MCKNQFLCIKTNSPVYFVGIIIFNTFSVALSIINDNLQMCYSLMRLINPSTELVPIIMATEKIKSSTFAIPL